MAYYWGTSEWTAQQLQEATLIAENLGLVGPKFDQLQMHMFVVHCINGLHNILHGGHVGCGLTWVIPAWDDPHHSQSWPMFVAKQFNLMVQCIFSPFLTKKSSQTGMTWLLPVVVDHKAKDIGNSSSL